MDKDAPIVLGDRLRRHREGLGWSQDVLALRLASKQSQISRLERGRSRSTKRGTTRVDVDLVCRAADAMGLRREYLFARDFQHSMSTMLGVVWQGITSPANQDPMQYAIQVAREELLTLEPAVVGVRLLLDVGDGCAFQYWDTRPSHFSSGTWSPADGGAGAGKNEDLVPLATAYRERRTVEYQRPETGIGRSGGQVRAIGVPLLRSAVGVSFSDTPVHEPKEWISELGALLEAGAQREQWAVRCVHQSGEGPR